MIVIKTEVHIILKAKIEKKMTYYYLTTSVIKQ